VDQSTGRQPRPPPGILLQAGSKGSQPQQKTLGTMVWTKNTYKHCYNQRLKQYGTSGSVLKYATFNLAKSACETESTCSAVYDSGCKGVGQTNFYLCQVRRNQCVWGGVGGGRGGGEA
jgi:hypothetical protein